MEITGVTYSGPPVDDLAVLTRIPQDLRRLLEQQNGFVAFRGGLHVRGACVEPAWHSLRSCWLGAEAFNKLYSKVTDEDIPFAQDAFGDQYLIRGGLVWRLLSETGDVEPLGCDLNGFMAAVAQDPVGFLALAPLLAFEAEGAQLKPGELLNVFPPFCMSSESEERNYRSVAAEDRLAFLADLANQIANVPDGQAVTFKSMEPSLPKERLE